MSMTSFDAEWAGLKQGPASDAQMRLACAAPDGGGGGSGGEDLKSDMAVWKKGSQDVGELVTAIKKALTGFETGQKGSAVTGVESAAAQGELYQSWKTYLDGLVGKCTTLQGPMISAGKGQVSNDETLRGDFARMTDAYKDTPATGGNDGGR
ncbi:hypothetical protein [Streptomyces sp. NBC_01233]|uniref:hypothetical protein n=1 Tax=Streptomyces sp. NBC_01233 TaxID=2903787 RepID=UPI002E0D8448|nr:hypothetical protein OG332_28470 [Streptomyces sp. NBC_01233]